MSTPPTVAIPVNVHRPDPVLFGLTAAQAGAFGAAGLGLWFGWLAVRAVSGSHGLDLTAGAYAGFSLMVLLAVAAVALGRRDGIGLGAWLRAAADYRRSPRRLAPEVGDRRIGPPRWLRATGPRGWARPPGPWRSPARGVDADGLVDLGPDGTAALIAAGTVTFGLRDPGTQAGLVAGYLRWLHGIGPRTQILVRAQPVSLAPLAARVRADRPRLATHALRAAAAEHAAYLHHLDAEYELITRQVTVSVRDRHPDTAVRRATQAAAELSAAGIGAGPLPAPAVHGLLGACLRPASGRPESRGGGSW